MNAHRVLVAHAHTMVRQSLRKLLEGARELVVVGDASDGDEAVRKTRDLRPDVAVIGIELDGCGGVEAVRQIKRGCSDVRVVALAGSDDDEDVVAAVQAGADGVVALSAPSTGLTRSVFATLAGEAVLSRAMVNRLLRAPTAMRASGHRGGPSYGLSDRERQVLRLVASGADNQQIAVMLAVSESTVRSHLHNVQGKLGLENRVQTALYALREGLYP